MLLPASRLLQVYNAVKTDKHASEDKSVIVFVSNGDVDSLCACQQLESIFGKDDIPLSIIPVENYEQVLAYCEKEKLGDTEDLKSIFLINCGATDDVRKLANLNDNVRAVIMDSHRPIWHGYNVESDQNTLVVLDDDDPVPRDQVPVFEERWDTQGEATAFRNEDNADGLDEDDRPGVAGVDQLRYQQAISAYYETKSGYGKPTALLLFQLAHSLQREDNFQIWLAILGVTDQFIMQRLDPLQYTRWREELERSVAQHNADDGQGDGDVDQQYGNNRARHRPTVVKIEGLRLAFLKRWTLSQSIMYNHHVATRLQTWRDAGKKQVEFLLSKLNIRAEQHTASFTSMHPAVEPHLREKLPQMVSHFGLQWEMLKYEGFELHYKNDVKLPAMDHVLAITAMLGRQRTPERSAQDVFREAVDCLNPATVEGVELLSKGIERAKLLAVQVVEQGGLALSRKQVQGGKNVGYWFLDLSTISFVGQNEFHHHSTLLKLAIFIRDANAMRVGHTCGMMVVGPPNENDECYIVTIRHKHQAGMMQANPFSLPLAEALRDCGAHGSLMQATFDSAIFVLRRHLVTAFCEELKAVVAAYREGMRQDTAGGAQL